MASNNEFEGKRLADICGGCETNIAVKWCKSCPVKLCTICAKSHQKLAVTKCHALVDIGSKNSGPNPVKVPEKGKCNRHNGQIYSSMCKECVQLLCPSCNSEHKGHSIQKLGDDAKLYQRVSSKHIQILLDDLHELEEVKALLESNIGTYEEAMRIVDQWELDLLKMVKQKADRLRKQLKELKDDKYKTLADKVNGLMSKLQELDKSITTLTEIRKSMDCQMLSKELASSQALIDKLVLYKTSLQPLPSQSNVTDVLPNGDKIKNVDNELDIMLTVGEIDYSSRISAISEVGNKVPKPVAHWKFTASSNGKDLSQYRENPVVIKNVKYGPGPNGEANGAAIFPTSKDRWMIVTKPTDKLRFYSGMTFFIHMFTEGTHKGPLFNYCDNYSNGLSFWVNNDSTSLNASGFSVNAKASNVLTPHTWHKITLVLDVSPATIYVDGKLVREVRNPVDFSCTQKCELYLGCYPSNVGRITGRVAEIKFFKEALSGTEIQHL